MCAFIALISHQPQNQVTFLMHKYKKKLLYFIRIFIKCTCLIIIHVLVFTIVFFYRDIALMIHLLFECDLDVVVFLFLIHVPYDEV